MRLALLATAVLLISATDASAQQPPITHIGTPPGPEQPAAKALTQHSVASGLKWLHEHQLADGGWSFDHTKAPQCQGRCGDPGKAAERRVAATGLALYAFLQVGQTTNSGKYKETVKRGIDFLQSRMKFDPDKGGKLTDEVGDSIGQALATSVLCEDYAMTHDRGRYRYAQPAVGYLIAVQDPKTGGWSPAAGKPFSMTATAWSLLALKSAHMAYLRVPPTAVKGADTFCRSLQTDGGAFFGERKAGKEPRATAAGLMCRMYLGAKKADPALARGVAYLAELGLSESDPVYNSFATAAMHLWHGSEWGTWQRQLHNELARSQATEGHEEGSWAPADCSEAKQGGRLYQTAINVATLAVRHRISPVISTPSVEAEFPD